MKFNIFNYNQERACKMGLDLKDLLILDWFQTFQPKMHTAIRNNKQYYWIQYENLIKDIPIIEITTASGLYKRLKNLVDMGILEHIPIKTARGGFSYYLITEKICILTQSHSPEKETLNPEKETLNPEKEDAIYNSSTINNFSINTKEKNIKKEKKKFIKPTLEEIIAFNEERKANVNCKRFFDHYDLNDWKDKNGNPVSNWKLKFIHNWEKNATTNTNNENNITKDKNESNLIEVKNNEINLFKNDSMNNIGLLNIDLSLQEKEKNNNHYDMLFNFYKVIAKEEYVYENDAYIFKKYLSKDEKFKYHIQFIKTNKNLYFSTIKDIINNTKQDENLNKILSFIRKQIILFFDKEIKFDKDFLQKFLLKIESFNFICIHKIFTLNLTYLYSTRAENIKCSREGFVFLKYKEFFNDSNFNEKLNIFLDN